MAARHTKDAAKGRAKTSRGTTPKGHATKRATTPRRASLTPSPSSADDHELSQVFQPRPVHLRLLAAFEAALQDGVNPSDTVIAKKLGVTRETINRWRGRSTQVWRWVHDHTGRRALELKPLVDRRVTELAISGSPEHTKLYYQFVAKMDVPFGDEPGAGRIVVNNNFLVPRPDYAAAAGLPPAQTPAAAAATRPAIPRVSVRGPVSPP